MFEHLKERFGLDEQLFSSLAKTVEFDELFRDYELLYDQSLEYTKGSEQYAYYQGLLFELEEEIVDVLMSQEENNI